MDRKTISTPCGRVRATLPLTAAAQPEQGRIRDVTDGDTFRMTTGERIRIAGIGAPETHADKACWAAEMALGDAAAARARTLPDGRSVGIERLGRSYSGTVARVTLGGRQLATVLVTNRVAWWLPRYAPKTDWCAGTTDRREGRARRGGRGANGR